MYLQPSRFFNYCKHIKAIRHLNIAVAMSGGIDSAVCALLLKRQGHNVSGIFMRNWDKDDEEGRSACTLHQDLLDMKEVCNRLNIQAFEVSFIREYWNNVFMPFIECYESGEGTPNPDVYCNSHIKFSSLRQHVINSMGFDTMATGHYARLETWSDQNIITATSRLRLLRGIDDTKDQSYFLCTTQIECFENVIFPLGNLTKAEIKRIAREEPLFEDLNVLQKKESMGVCFIGKRNMSDFLPQYFTPTGGRFIDITARSNSKKVVGTHTGAELFTIGQKCRIGGCAEKYYIVKKKLTNSGDLLVAPGQTHPALYCEVIQADWSKFNWMSRWHLEMLLRGMNSSGCGELLCEMRYRHQQKPIPCKVSVFKNYRDSKCSDKKDMTSPLPVTMAPKSSKYECASEQGEVVLRIDCVDGPVRAVAPGQILALYKGDECLGGGPISFTYSSFFDTFEL